jgi:two-component system chemotaxis response regulator CheB
MNDDGSQPLTVLVVDDSAVVREVASGLLSLEPGITAITAADALIALDKMRVQRPDVILLDLEMPRMDGLTFLRKLMVEDPLPVVVCSSLAGRGTEAALRALEEGAVEVVAKPKVGVRDFLHESAVMLIDTLRAAARARLGPCPPPKAPGKRAVLPPADTRPTLRFTTAKVLALGASTGGTEALRLILEALPADAPGTVVVQHMPEGFTAAFAKRLDQSCRVEVKEAAHGDWLREGRALIAPGNRHTTVVRSGANYAVSVGDGPLVSRHRPSVDVLFQSVARAAGPNAVGIILTGMGNDGAAGLLEMREAGAATIAQDESTCVVFGMPKEAIALGAVDEVLPLPRIAPAALQRARDVGAVARRRASAREPERRGR